MEGGCTGANVVPAGPQASEAGTASVTNFQPVACTVEDAAVDPSNVAGLESSPISLWPTNSSSSLPPSNLEAGRHLEKWMECLQHKFANMRAMHLGASSLMQDP